MVSPFPVDFQTDHLYWETSRGCAFNCIYCSHSGMKNYFKEVPHERLEREIEYLKKLENLRAIYITDSVLGGRKENTKKVLKLISALEGKVFVTASLRPEYLDDEIIQLLRKAKIGWLDIGLQTTNSNLSYFRKTDLEKITRLGDLTKKGVSYNLDLISGIPGDTVAGLKETVRYTIEEAKPTTFRIFRLRVYEGTRLHQMALEKSWKFDKTSREIEECPGFEKDELDSAMKYSNSTVLMYRFMVEKNWFGNENKYRRLKFFNRFFDEISGSSAQEAKKFLSMQQTDYKRELLEDVWRLTNEKKI